MGDEREWQKQLLGAALMAAARTGIEYLTNPEARDETVEDVKSRLAEVDYSAAARAVSTAIDSLAESSKTALNDAIDSLRANAEDAVEAAAERAQEQLGSRKRGRGKLFFGIILGVILGFVLLNEDRRNQLMDKITGASGPIDTAQWTSPASTAQEPVAPVTEPSPATAPSVATPPEPVVAAEPASEEKSSSAKETGKGKKSAGETDEVVKP